VPISPGDFNLAVKAEIETTLAGSVPVTVSASVPNSTAPTLPVVPSSHVIITLSPVRPMLIPLPSSTCVTAKLAARVKLMHLQTPVAYSMNIASSPAAVMMFAPPGRIKLVA